MSRRIFEKMRLSRPGYSGFDLSHDKKLSFNPGELIPVFWDEIVPGDQYSVRSEVLLRFSPLIAPIMHRVNIFVHYFFVPTRLLWDEWADFITGGEDGTLAPTMPGLIWGAAHGASAADVGSLADYLGLPTYDGTAQSAQRSVSILPFRAYQEIYNEYYRDQNLTTAVDPTVTSEALTLRKRAWEKDYFTSALPFTQRGTAPEVPLDGSLAYDTTPEFSNPAAGTENLVVDNLGNVGLSGGNTGAIENLSSTAIDGLSININELRRTSAIQRWMEKQARGGGRYIETILSQFGVKSSDARLQRPEYLGGGQQPVVISEVLNTSDTSNAPQGNMSGHAVSLGGQNKFRARFEEHGYVMGLMSVLPRTAYQQGINKKWLRTDKFDFFWPEFAHLGEQAVSGVELYYDTATASNNLKTFGYQQRYAEYKFAESSVHGEFRTTLDHWHWGRQFASSPDLNTTFVESVPDDRIFAVTTGNPNQMLAQVYNNVKARRPMPFFANPKLT
jgi:hypothetical protein